MNKKYSYWLIVAVVLLVAIVVGGQQWLKSGMGTVISESEAKLIVEEKYAGEIIHLERVNSQFVVDVERETGTYRIVLDDKSGTVLSVNKISEPEKIAEAELLTEEEIKNILLQQVEGTVQSIKKTPEEHYQVVVKEGDVQHSIVMDGRSGEVLDSKIINGSESDNEVEQTQRLTEQEAMAIALNEVPGEVDDVEQESINGIIHYYVEVETTNGKEAVVEIHSITGEIKSLTWED